MDQCAVSTAVARNRASVPSVTAQAHGPPTAGRRSGRAAPLAVSLVIHALAAGAIVALLPASRRAPADPVRLVFMEALPPPRAAPAEEAAAVANATPPAPVPEPQAPPRSEAQAPRREPLREPAKPTPTRKGARGPARRPARSEERPVQSAAEPAEVPPAPDAVASSGRAGGVPGGVGTRVYAASAVPVPPVLVTREMPTYPPEARRREVEGVVLIEAIVGTDGRIEPGSVKVRESVALLDTAAADAVGRWRFRPGRDRLGAPVRVILEIPVRFVLR
jgi:protein TonB